MEGIQKSLDDHGQTLKEQGEKINQTAQDVALIKKDLDNLKKSITPADKCQRARLQIFGQWLVIGAIMASLGWTMRQVYNLNARIKSPPSSTVVPR